MSAPSLRLSRRAATVLALALVAATPATAGAQAPAGKSVTATGLGQVAVTPQDRHKNASILAAVHAAEAKAVPQAIAEAREHATALAAASGLTLGAIESISDAQQQPFFYGPVFGAYPAPFGKDRYCGTETRAIVRRTASGTRRVVGHHKVHVCRPPRFVIENLTVTFAAT